MHDLSAAGKRVVWTADDAEITRAAVSAADGERFDAPRGLYGYGEWSERAFGAKYIHTDGGQFVFSRSWRSGSGNPNRRCMRFTPEGACIVTVVYAAKPGRPLFIYQGDTLLAGGTDEPRDGFAPSLAANIEEPLRGDVIIRGGASDKDVFAIIVDYYDPAEIVYHRVSGRIKYNGGADMSGAEIVFRDMKDGGEYKAAFGGEYAVRLRRSRRYEVSVRNADGVCVTLDTRYIRLDMNDLCADIELCDIAPRIVEGDVVIHEIYRSTGGLDMDNIKLYFVSGDNKYIADIDGGRLKISLMPGKYRIYAEGIDGYSLSALSTLYELEAGDTLPFKNILIKENIRKSEYIPIIEVGGDKEFSRINDAVAAVRAMRRDRGEAGRVTIEVSAGTYTEQVLLNVPYITLKAAEPEHRPVISFYYAIAYLYYSAAADKYYDEDYAVAKTKKGPVAEWGPACRITAEHVKVSDIIVKNSFNCELTEAEFDDGCEPAKSYEYPDTNGKQARDTRGYDVMLKAATERAAAIAVTGDHCELYNCDFISSQDTFYTNCKASVKNCYIEGNVDYVFGGGDVVFEDCTLAWHGYSDTASGGYISANKNPDKSSPGHVFKNCVITNSKYYPDNKFTPGHWGRNWGGECTRAAFINTKMAGVDVPGGWVKMNGGLDISELYVTGVTDRNGGNVDDMPFNPNGKR